MKIKDIVENDEYLSQKKNSLVNVGRYLKHQWLYLLGIFAITFVASLTTFTSVSYFNSNSQKIEASTLTEVTDFKNEVTLKSTIRDGLYPNDIFSSPDNQISYLQRDFPSIKTIKIYNAYETYRGTDTVNGFYYIGNPNDKPDTTYYDRFNDNVRRYTNFLCVDDGSYLDIELEYSANPVTINETNEDGVVISSHVEYKFMTGYVGNEIYLPYDFAVNTLLPQYQNGYFGHDPEMRLQDLINKEFVLFSVMKNSFMVDGNPTGQSEIPYTYIIKGFTKDTTNEELKDYFIVPFNKAMLTQPRVFFKPSSNAAINDSFMSAVYKLNSSGTILEWGISTKYSEPLANYISSNAPARRVGIFMALTILILVLDGFIFFLYLVNVNKKDSDKRVLITTVSSSVTLFLAAIFAGAVAKVINGSSLFAWTTSIGKLKTAFFTLTASTINSLICAILIIGGIIASIMLLKYFKNKKEKQVIEEQKERKD